jgi:hypothetical protein
MSPDGMKVLDDGKEIVRDAENLTEVCREHYPGRLPDGNSPRIPLFLTRRRSPSRGAPIPMTPVSERLCGPRPARLWAMTSARPPCGRESCSSKQRWKEIRQDNAAPPCVERNIGSPLLRTVPPCFHGSAGTVDSPQLGTLYQT